MFSLFALLMMWCGARLMSSSYDIDSPGAFFGGILLLVLGLWLLGESLGMERTGRAFG